MSSTVPDGRNHSEPSTRNEASLRPEPSDHEGIFTPARPSRLQDTGVDREILADLTLKLASTLSSFTTQRAANDLRLPEGLAADLLDYLKKERLIEILGEAGVGYRFTITETGRNRAVRLFEISGYVGPAPVSLEAYTESMEIQLKRLPAPTAETVGAALSDLVLPDQVVELAGLASLSRRTLFLYGPSGNGKTSVGLLLHAAAEGHLWIPYCIGIDSNIIRIFDAQVHERVPADPVPEGGPGIDGRWIRIRRPFAAVGGECTPDDLELSFSPTLRFYEAPLHMKANGGTFLLDDFGFQKVEPTRLLGRWIYPMEHQVDYLTLQTGQKFEVPFRQMLIVSTNLNPEKVMNPAFLRRMGYRIYLGDPTPEAYAKVFAAVARRYAIAVPPGLVDRLIDRYRAENRPLRGCQPRDLVARARDLCTYRSLPLELDDQIMDTAWKGYFGDKLRSND